MASDSSAYNLEYRDNGDDAWYAVKLVVPEFGVTLTVKYLDFPDSCDVTFRAEQFTTVSEVDELMNRFRPVSRQMQDYECDKITNGVTVCASYSFGTDDLRFYDAVVKAVHREKHSFVSGEEECLCTFVLLWQHGPNVGNQTSDGIGSICILQQAAAQLHPKILRFSIAAKERIASKLLAKSSNVSKGMTKKSHPDQLRDEDTGGGSFHTNEFVETGGIHNFLVVENLELDLSPTTIREFIYKQTSISSQAYVFPRQSSEPYARGAIVSECEKGLEKIYDFLNNNNRLVVSTNGRPWVVTEKASRSGMFTTTLGSSIHKSQVTSTNGYINKELEVVHSGTEEYTKAKHLMSLFMNFKRSEQRLRKSLGLEV